MKITKVNDIKMNIKTRVYAIDEKLYDEAGDGDIHDFSDDSFMDVAEQQGNVWSLCGFQNLLNCEGEGHLDFHKLKSHYFRFIDVFISFETKKG